MGKDLTALVCCFVRCYHYKNNDIRIFSDNVAEKILSHEEYLLISNNMANGINFFNPNFNGTPNEALRWIIDNQLSPSVLGRSAFCEKSLKNAIVFGCCQYLIFASGYDTFAYWNFIDDLMVFEIDREDIINDKIKRLEKNNIDHSKVNFITCDFNEENWFLNVLNSNYKQDIISFCSLLGISYYLTKDAFYNMIKTIANFLCKGSSIVFDCPTYDAGRETKINEQLAKEADEEMKAKYTYFEIEKMLAQNGLLIYEHLDDEEMTNTYFFNYNSLNSKNKIYAPKGVNYCLAVRR